jgi:thiol:disulfide interchange protein
MRRWSLRMLTRHERLLWIGLLVVVATVRWPLLKGLYYRAAHVAAPASTIAWQSDLDTALAEARRTGRPVLVDFSASWCPPCIVMKHEVWPDPTIERAVADSYVPLFVDVDRNAAVSDRFGIESIPTILVLDGGGHVVRRAAFLSTSGMRHFLSGD